MPAGVIYDSDHAGGYADLTVAKPCSELLFSRHDESIPNSLIARQSFTQLRADRAILNIGSTISIGQPYYLIQETEPIDMGGGMVMWDRVYAALPQNHSKNVVVTKTYYAGEYIFSGTVDPRPIVDQSIVTFTKPVTGTMYLEFYPSSISLPSLPSSPFIQTIRFFGQQVITDLGSGFPTFSLYGNTVFSNNFAFSFVSASIEPYLGDMTVLKKIYA